MYKEFFQLSRSPFDLTPDPFYLVATRCHNEALATLHYGIRSHKGFIVLTGEVGTGKTLVLRCLFRLLQHSRDIAYAYHFHSTLRPVEFLQSVLLDFGITDPGNAKGDLLRALHDHIVQRGQQNLTTVLVVDEAHLLPAEVLEELRLLGNLETNEHKLLQIVLVGQPELEQKLDSPGLRQLKQRIGLRARLTTLDEEECRRYIYHRLKTAGCRLEPERIFPPESIAAVALYSQGFPRLINTLCENSLIHGFARHTRTIPAEVVAEVAREFRLEDTRLTLGEPVVVPHEKAVRGTASVIVGMQPRSRAALRQEADVSSHPVENPEL